MDWLPDDLGHPVPIPCGPRRVISLVPSLTEAVEVSAPGRLVGATDWCTHPAGLDVTRVRGTKNPDRGAIAALKPDLVVANQEENREFDVRRLRAEGIPVWVTRIESLDEAFRSLRRLLVEVMCLGEEPTWLRRARQAWADPGRTLAERAVVPVWRDPWLVVGPHTFADDLLSRLGIRNAFSSAAFSSGALSSGAAPAPSSDSLSPGRDRYPRLELAALHAADPDLVVLPDEPYAFAAADGPEAFPDTPVALVSGRGLTWYGPSLATARDALLAQIGAARTGRVYRQPGRMGPERGENRW